MKSKKTQKKSSLKSLILILLLTATLLVVSTYAWFTANRDVYVSDIEVNVEVQNGIEISSDGYNWRTILTVDDLKNASTTYPTAVNQIPSILRPVSTAGVLNADGRQVMYYGDVKPDETVGSPTYGQYVLNSQAVTDANGTEGHYVAFDVFLKIDSTMATTPVYLAADSNITVPDTSTDTGLKNTARISFINEGNIDKDNVSDVNAIQSLKTSTNPLTADGAAYIWEPNANSHTASGISNAFTYYGLKITGADKIATYEGLNSVFTDKITLNKANSTEHETYFKTVTPALQTEVNNTAQTNLMSLKSGVTKVRIYMWVEGQDVDCENGASGSAVTLNLHFTTNAG